MVKFYGQEEISEKELRKDLEGAGLRVERLEEEGRLRFFAEEDPAKRNDLLERLLEEGSENGSDGRNERALWASFDWSYKMSLEEALEQQEKVSQVTSRRLVVKTAALGGGHRHLAARPLETGRGYSLGPDLALQGRHIQQPHSAVTGLVVSCVKKEKMVNKGASKMAGTDRRNSEQRERGGAPVARTTPAGLHAARAGQSW